MYQIFLEIRKKTPTLRSQNEKRVFHINDVHANATLSCIGFLVRNRAGRAAGKNPESNIEYANVTLSGGKTVCFPFS